MYIKRHLEETILKMSKMFGAILVSGPRQVGKTTLLKELMSEIPYITLDDPILLQSAIEEAGTFFKSNPPPVFVDEIQYAPNLFPYIKMILDNNSNECQFYMSGSQQFKMMKNVSESLAGRLGITNLLGLSLREIKGCIFNKPFIPTEEYFSERKKELKEISYKELWEIIHRGSMPKLYSNPNMDWKIFYGSYTKTYIERDVRELTQVGDEMKFLKFMTVLASCTGQLLNLSSISRDVGISQPTAERWLSILTASNIVYLLQPFSNNLINRAIKTPKIYFLDTGLAAYLTKWSSPDVLEAGAMAGAFFETFIISEIIKSYYNAGVIDPSLYFYRDKDNNEIDLLIENDGKIYPLEIKRHASPSKNDIKAFSRLNEKYGIIRGSGGIICSYDNLAQISEDVKAIPINFI